MNVDERLAALLALAEGDATPKEEARTAAYLLVQFAKKHGRKIVFVDRARVDPDPFVDSWAPPRPEPAPVDLGAFFDVLFAASERRAHVEPRSSIPPWLRDAMRAAAQTAVRETAREVAEAVRRAPKKRKR